MPKAKDFRLDTEKDDEPFKQNKPIVLRPSHIEGRIRAQASIFTVHNYIGRNGRTVGFERLPANKRRLIKLVIPPGRFATLRYNLDQFGIDESVIFPDLTAVCHNIEWRHSILDDEKGFKWNDSEQIWEPPTQD